MKLKFFLSALFFLSISISGFSQEEVDWDSKVFETGEFNKIRIEGAFKVYLIQGDKCSVKVNTTGSEIFDKIKIRNFNNEVEIELDQALFDFSRISLYITFKTLEKLEIEGGVSLKTNGYIDLDKFDVNISGGANLDLNMKVDVVKIYGEGGFLFDLKGVANVLDITINGAGHVNAADLKTKDVNFAAVGFGTSSVYATEKLNAKIEGVGKVSYKGNPKVTQYIDGLGSVKPYSN